MARIGVIGGGAFGTALACVMRRSGHETTLWAREPEVVEAINREGFNPLFLPRIALVPGIRATGELGEAAARADLLLLAPPAQHMRAVAGELRPLLKAGTPVVTCSKGIERRTCALMSEVLAEALPGARVAVLSGPSFAHDIATDQPVGVTLACADSATGEVLARTIGTGRFRVYRSDDVVGVLLGGALKNVIAIACGVALGKKLGESSRATLFARGLAEMARLGVAMGARAETFIGLSGAGDLNLSCNSASSRNTSLGIALGEGRDLADIMGSRRTVQEGVHSAESAAGLAARYDVDMPIVRAVDRVLNHAQRLEQVIAELLSHSCRFDGVAAPRV